MLGYNKTMELRKIPHDVIGDIAIMKFPRIMKNKEKIVYSRKFLKQNPHIKTVLEKIDKFKGRLRKSETGFIAGENKKLTVHRENDCSFILDVDETYFSPRLSNERKVISDEILRKITNKKNKILVMFAGVAPFPVVIGRKIKQSKKIKNFEIISNELNRKANKFAEENIRLNKLNEHVRVVSGDSNKLFLKLKKYKADFIVMPRPNLKDTFLKSALKLSKKGTIIYYYGFGEKKEVLEEIRKNTGKNIQGLKIRKAGEIAPYRSRWLAKFVVK